MYRLLLVDNHDSFVYNLRQCFEEASCEVTVRCVEEVKPEEALAYHAVVLSPGPGLPEEVEGLVPLIRFLAGKRPLLGVCLGHQAIAQAFGARLIQPGLIRHGYQDKIAPLYPKDSLFHGLPNPFPAGRYHSWTVDPSCPGEGLSIIAENQDKMVMAIRHSAFPIIGFQFHPESYMSPDGPLLLRNWLALLKRE